MDIKQQILVALGLNKDEEVKLAWQAKSEDGTIFVSTAEELEPSVDISVLTEDGTTIPLPIGTYKTDTGVSFRVEEEGVVGEVIESETEEKEEASEEVKEEMTEEVELAPEDESRAEETDWAKTYEQMKEKVENLEDAIADIKARLGEGDSEEVEMTEETTQEVSDSPKTVTTKTTEVVEFSAEEELENLKAENEKLKTELAASPADNPINTNKFSSDKKVSLSKKQLSKLTKKEQFLYNLYN
tara:strand:- start:14 stop:742 length:729 start_codon:yes stop_codon:yes gene_type:complete